MSMSSLQKVPGDSQVKLPEAVRVLSFVIGALDLLSISKRTLCLVR